jgi:hypothetical protein
MGNNLNAAIQVLAGGAGPGASTDVRLYRSPLTIAYIGATSDQVRFDVSGDNSGWVTGQTRILTANDDGEISFTIDDSVNYVRCVVISGNTGATASASVTGEPVATIGGYGPGRTSVSITDAELAAIINAGTGLFLEMSFTDEDGHQLNYGCHTLAPLAERVMPFWPVSIFGLRGYFSDDHEPGAAVFCAGPYPDEAEDLAALQESRGEDRAVLLKTIGPKLRAAGHRIDD